MKSYHSKYMWNALVLFGMMLAVSCSSKSEQPSETPEAAGSDELIEVTSEQFKSSGYELGSLTKRGFRTTVNANGVVDVPHKYQAAVSAYFGGYVKEIDLLNGSKVEKGQVLFTLENPAFVEVQKDFLETEGELKYLKEDLDRQRDLADANVSSQKKFSKAEADYLMMKAKNASLRKKLELMNVDVKSLTADKLRSTINILSPLSGYVTEINASPGTFLSPSEVALRITNTEHMHLELKVFEQDASKIKSDQKIRYKVQNAETEHEAVVHLVNKIIDPVSRTVIVHGHVGPAPTSDLVIGSYLEAQIVVGSDSLLSLPSAAIAEIDNIFYVLQVSSEQNGTTEFIKKKVNVGQVQDGFTAILNADEFQPTDKFLILGAFDLIRE